jgi:hypothetical protein
MATTGNVSLALPLPTLGVIGLESDTTANIMGGVNLSLPTPVFSAGASVNVSVALTLPTPTLTAAASTPIATHVALALPTPKLAVAAKTATAAHVALVLPTPTLSVALPNTTCLTLPTPKLSIVARTGVVGRSALALPTPSIAATASTENASAVRMALPVLHLAATATTGAAVGVNLALPRLALAAEGFTGTVGEVTIALPALELDAGGYGEHVAEVELTLPLLIMQATATSGGAGPALPAITMHTETLALAQYDNFPFNSFARFGSMYLAASDQGLFMLGGDVDNGALIKAAARVGITDFGTSFLKRVDRSYVGYRTNGDLVVRVYTDEVDARDYLLQATGRLGLHGNHFRIGKGLRARFWQFEVTNVNGADFTLDSIELKPTQLRRRIGSWDA